MVEQLRRDLQDHVQGKLLRGTGGEGVRVAVTGGDALRDPFEAVRKPFEQ